MSSSTSGPNVFADPYVTKREVVGTVVAVLRGVTDRRGLAIEEYRSRAVRCGDIHELMTTDQRAELRSSVDRVALLAFFEIEQGGVLLVGDAVEVAGHSQGVVCGFNDTHMPNHQNICLHTEFMMDGETAGIQIGDAVRILRASG